jgi:hypothetical protein
MCLTKYRLVGHADGPPPTNLLWMLWDSCKETSGATISIIATALHVLALVVMYLVSLHLSALN